MPRAVRLGLATRGDNRLSPDDVSCAVERGVNYLNWCGREDGLSRFVRESRSVRRDIVVAVQFKARTRDEADRELDRIAEILGGPADILTLYYVESNEEWDRIVGPAGSWNVLAERRRTRRLAMIGVTTHQRPLAAKWAGQVSLDGEPRLDLLMVRYNAAHRGAEREVFPATEALGTPVVCFTGLRWGALLEPASIRTGSCEESGWAPSPAECYRFCLSNAAVSVMLTAPKTRAELEESLGLLDDWRAMDDEDAARMRAHGDRIRAAAGEFW